ncbi:MAG TPA: CaiB/BaiF CoA-transferase family protein [Candidatus Binatia bacterium]|nr:CaiB/BaiF CoA-transferase family protein [Candidatus Binatia bacterium]
MHRRGPLSGLRVLEIAAIGPVPFAGMLLSDLGAEVIRVDRTRPDPTSTWTDPRLDVLGRGRRSIALDLKSAGGAAVLLRLVERADILLEGFRPGVAERLGIGPKQCMQRNPRLVYGRMTGWGQHGTLAAAAGHDINYIALTGALHAVGSGDQAPTPPLNLVGDFGGGALYLVVGVLSALLERARSGKGDVIDAAMVDGAASLMSIFYVMQQIGFWRDERGANFLDGGAHFYGTYRTADDKYVAIGAIESRFYDELLARLGLSASDLPAQHDRDGWQQARARLAEIFRTRTRAQWCELLEGTDACFAPVLSIGEAAEHPHLRERATLVEIDGVRQPAPAPRFERSATERPRIGSRLGADTRAVLSESGFGAGEIDALLAAHTIAEGIA